MNQAVSVLDDMMAACESQPMTGRPTPIALLATAALLLLTACGAAPAPSEPTVAPEQTPASSPAASQAAAETALAELEEASGARVGVYAVDTASGATIGWREDERFAYASVIKALAAAVVLDRTDEAELAEVVTWSEEELVDYSPVTELHVEDGLPLAEVAEAAITVSDNTAGNLLFDQVGGPAALDEALAELGDDVTQVAREEPDLNEAVPDDPRDTSTPAALVQTMRAVAVQDALAPEDRDQLVTWLEATTTGDDLVRAAVPDGWTVGDKTGSAGYGTRNDLAIAWPPGGGAPVVIAVMTTHPDVDAESDDALVAAAAEIGLEALGLS